MEEQNEIIKRINKLETQVSINKRIDLLEISYQEYERHHNKSKLAGIFTFSLLLIIMMVVYYEYFVMNFDLLLPACLIMIPLSTFSLGFMNQTNRFLLRMRQIEEKIELLQVERSLGE